MTRRKGKNKESPSFHINHCGSAAHRNDSRRNIITKKWVCISAHPLSVSSNTGLYSKGSCYCGQYGNDDFNDFLPNAFFFHCVLFFKLVFGFTFFFLSAERKKITKKKDCRLHFSGYSGRVFR